MSQQVFTCLYLLPWYHLANQSIAVTILHQQMAKVISLMLRSSAPPVIQVEFTTFTRLSS